VSYDPTREFYAEYNKLFAKHLQEKTGQVVNITQSHGGSAKQARSVIDGLKADVVTLALASDIDAIAERTNILPKDWQSKLPNNSTPYNSIVVFLVRKDNPKHIKDWNDLVRDDVSILTPNPKTSGGSRWNYLAAWSYAMKANNNSEDEAKKFIAKLFKNVPILDTGARGATTNFIKRNIGDVLITWENEALFIKNKIGKDQYEVVIPSLSILAEPPVAVLEENAKQNGTATIAKDYLEYLYSKEAQAMIAEFYYRPSNAEIAAKYASSFPTVPLVKIADFGGWKAADAKHFADGGTFDQIYSAK
ncbi:MAG: sulfate ABC transporter substrate-binding protein, partial [Pseudomonadota bacterium]